MNSPQYPQHRPAGLRSRIVAAAPPAPVPEKKSAAPVATQEDHSLLKEVPQPKASASTEDVVRSTGSMAIATLLSRITGFVRTAMIGAALGAAVGSAFTVANTLPNLITEIVLGAVLTSLVVPVLVRAEKEDPDQGAAFIRRLFTLAALILIVVTLAAVAGAGWLTRMLLDEGGEVNTVQATSFAILLLPQIFFYGIFSLFMAILNTKEIFKPGAWAPVANNVVSIAVLAAYMVLPGSLDPAAPSPISDPHVLLLGAGTTAGVVTQALIMLPYLRRAGIDLRPLWGIDDRLKQFAGMAAAIIVYVAISQAGYVATTRIASASSEAAPIIYSNHWLLLQVPYGVIGVTLLTAIMPRLSRNAADGNDQAVVKDLTVATNLTLIAMLPIVVFFMLFGVEIASALFTFGAFTGGDSRILGFTLAFSAFTLIPYAIVLLHLRVFYAREEAWTPTWIIAGITVVKVALSLVAPIIASSPDRVIILLGAANGFGFVAGACIGALLLHRKLGSLRGRETMRTSVWSVGSALVGALGALAVSQALRRFAAPLFDALGKLGEFAYLGIVGVVFLVLTGVVLARSGIAEVRSLGAVFRRIPGLGRFIRTSPDDAPAADTTPEPTEVPDLFTRLDSWLVSPVLPPMSAGMVRPPRQVPGAPVADGRFRLLAKQGETDSMSFWQAREQGTGKLVAMTFVDNAHAGPDATEQITTATRQLASLQLRGVARGVHVLPYPMGALVLADWVAGSAVTKVAESGADPHAAQLALAPLVDAAAQAHEAESPLGLVSADQVRIDTDGHAVLAFPVVCPSATTQADVRHLQEVVDLLVVEDSPQLAEADLHEVAQEMRAEKAAVDELEVAHEPTPDVPLQPGFGASQSRPRTALIAAIVIALVLVAGAGAAHLVGTLGKNDPESPITPGALEKVEEKARNIGPEQLGDAATDLNTGAAADAINDQDPETTWTGTSVQVYYSVPFHMTRFEISPRNGEQGFMTLKSGDQIVFQGKLGTADMPDPVLTQLLTISFNMPVTVQDVKAFGELHDPNAPTTSAEPAPQPAGGAGPAGGAAR